MKQTPCHCHRPHPSAQGEYDSIIAMSQLLIHSLLLDFLVLELWLEASLVRWWSSLSLLVLSCTGVKGDTHQRCHTHNQMLHHTIQKLLSRICLSHIIPPSIHCTHQLSTQAKLWMLPPCHRLSLHLPVLNIYSQHLLQSQALQAPVLAVLSRGD